MRLNCFSLLRNEAGVSFVELALCAPVLLLLCAGIFEIGLGLQHQRMIAEAARQAARTVQRYSIETGSLNATSQPGDLNADANLHLCDAKGIRIPNKNTFRTSCDLINVQDGLIDSNDNRSNPTMRNLFYHEHAVRAACATLLTTGISPEDIIVRTDIFGSKQPDSMAHASFGPVAPPVVKNPTFSVVRVRVERKKTGNFSHGLFKHFIPDFTSESSFHLRGLCSQT